MDGDEIDIVPAVEGGSGDVRMRGFRERTPFERARELATGSAAAEVRSEGVFVGRSAGRILAADVASEVDVPPFDRSAMDGYAIRAESSFGADPLDPPSLLLVAESMPGAPAAVAIGPGEACRIMTGAPMPAGADAVLMAEDAEERGDRVLLKAAVTPGKNVGRIGEDIARGVTVLRAGRRLRPQDAGLLASIGQDPVPVRRRPRVRILVTGNELLPPGEKPRAGMIVDSNSPMLEALVARDGGELIETLRLADDREAIAAAMRADDVDVLLCAGGSSVGREDHLPLLLAELGELVFHGVAMRPAAPAGFGRIDDRRVFLLPGNPVSCLCAYDFFAGPLIRALQGMEARPPYRARTFRLARRVASMLGRFDYVRVETGGSTGEVLPIAASGASLLSTTTRALGYLVVPEDSEGLAEGAEVEVFLYDDGETAR